MLQEYVLLVLVGFASVVVAQIPNLGFCPDYVPVSDFDMEKFLGRWYEAERYFAVSEVASRCVTTEYTKGSSGKVYVSNEITNRLTSIKRIIDGTLEYTGRVGEGTFKVKYNAFPPFDTTYKILDTDYTTYAVLWSCSGIGPVNTQNAWVYTRDRNPSVPTLQRAYGVLDKYKISRTFFLKTDQKDCALGGDAEEQASASLTRPEDENTEETKSEAIPVAEHILTAVQQQDKNVISS